MNGRKEGRKEGIVSLLEKRSLVFFLVAKKKEAVDRQTDIWIVKRKRIRSPSLLLCAAWKEKR
jgi:hypothetical protein